MKNLILLFLVIGAVVSDAIELTTTAAASVTAPLWTITFAAPATFEEYYSFTLTYNSGDSAQDVLPADNATPTKSTGVACLFTDSAFALSDGDIRAGITLNINSAAAALSTSDISGWTALLMTAHPVMEYTDSGNLDTKAGGVDCPITVTNTGNPDPVVDSAFIVSWTFTVANSCGALPQMGAAWHAKCWYVEGTTQAKLLATASQAVVISGGKEVTVAAATTTCATTGASTFATGATILAGIAYLQF
jgi:hypothetical protein